MIQGGDPNGDGTGGSSEKIKGEFKSNGVQNNISHIRGTISMARSSANNSASSQFFIMQRTLQALTDNTQLSELSRAAWTLSIRYVKTALILIRMV